MNFDNDAAQQLSTVLEFDLVNEDDVAAFFYNSNHLPAIKVNFHIIPKTVYSIQSL